MNWIEAAHADQLSYEEFRQKPVDYQEKLIAHFETKQQIEAVVAHANRPRKRAQPPRPRPPRRGRR